MADVNPPVAARLVAIDGPAGAGKSTVARRLATALGFAYLDTGATYRAATLAVLQERVAPDNAAAVADVVARLMARGALALALDPARPRVDLDGLDVSATIREPPVTAAVSAVSAVPAVRRLLVAWQRERALATAGCVLEGRDTGAVVTPEAGLKVWLTAAADVRAARRSAEADAAAAADLARRDRADAGRETDPMRPAPDALLVDSSALDADAVVALLLTRLHRCEPAPR